jgi:predicted nucleic acid-binding protein
LPKAGYLLDTNFLISVLQEEPWAKAYLGSLENDLLFISVITEMEILSYHRLTKDEEWRARQIFNQLTIVDINGPVKQLSINIRRSFHLKMPDAIIAATAVYMGAALVSNDTRLLSISQIWPELSTIKPRSDV